MLLPLEVRLRCRTNGSPVGGVWFELDFRGKEWPTGLLGLFGPTDKSGLVQVTRRDLHRELEEVMGRLSAPIDSIEEWWNGRLHVRLASAESVRRLVRRSYDEQDRLYGNDDVRRKALTCLRSLQRLAGAEPAIEVELDPPEAAMVAIAERSADEWIRAEWVSPIRSILHALTDADFERLVVEHFIAGEEAEYIGSERMEFQASFVIPPDDVFLLAEVEETADGEWFVRSRFGRGRRAPAISKHRSMSCALTRLRHVCSRSSLHSSSRRGQ